VVDNEGSPAVARAVAEARNAGLGVELLVPGENLGPAGATAVGMRQILKTAADSDWITRLDDDGRPLPADLFKELLAAAIRAQRVDPAVAAVGTAGATFDFKKAILSRPDYSAADEEFIDVDYVATGFSPAFSVAAVRQVGGFNGELFYGLSEVEFGLRLRAGGFRILVSRPLRQMVGRLHRRPPPQRVRLTPPSWRQYYSLRNLIFILVNHHHQWVAVRVALVRGVLKPLANAVITPRLAWRHVRINVQAIADGFGGRLGRRYVPGDLEGAAIEDYQPIAAGDHA
jgi:glycosyltransferase involved in cell wall biosynthesis